MRFAGKVVAMVIVGVLPSACGVPDAPLVARDGPPGFTVSLESGWTEPEHLDPPINSAFRELGGSFSRDGLSMYFGSDRPPGQGGFATRFLR